MRHLFLLLTVITLPAFAQPTDLSCLTANIFFEARGESHKGKRAIADTTLNRTKHTAFKGQDTVCKVVFAKGQFSWTFQQPKKRIQKLLNGDLRGLKDLDIAAYHEASIIAQEALDNVPRSKLPSSVVNFHTTDINPTWAKGMRKYTTIGKHVFYSFKRKGK